MGTLLINKANILNEQFQSVFSPSTNIDREECCNQNYMADTQEDYPESGDINVTNTGVEKLLKNRNLLLKRVAEGIGCCFSQHVSLCD
jgi:hypothetical protein